ncbi:MAG: polymerase primary sigma factor [Solirubrobacteraceae bacterium]|jgi:RNA polymerase sigma factor (sigma-70 family)|nr:polymerase primary sigma factor [Solirubrobacteraceae bacterium]
MGRLGFAFRYRLCGAPPTVLGVRCGASADISRGDLVSVEDDVGRLAVPGDRAVVGVALDIEDDRDHAALVQVITDADAVYAVADSHDRDAGTALALTGPTGEQGVGDVAESGEFEVVAASEAADETLVRIRIDTHHEVTVALRPGFPARFLSHRHERALVAAAAVGDPAAASALVEAFLPTISGVAQMYRNVKAVERTELIQEGVVGLLRALKRYDPSLGTPFWGYASWWVRQAMQQLVAEVTRPMVLSDRALRGLARVKAARAAFLQEHARDPTSDELADAVELTREQVDSLLAIERTPRGLEEPIGGEAGVAGTLGELIEDPGAQAAFASVLDRFEIEQVRDLTEALDDRERRILTDHYGLGRPARTLREIGDDLGVSAERVRQIEERTLARLRDAVASPAP